MPYHEFAKWLYIFGAILVVGLGLTSSFQTDMREHSTPWFRSTIWALVALCDMVLFADICRLFKETDLMVGIWTLPFLALALVVAFVIPYWLYVITKVPSPFLSMMFNASKVEMENDVPVYDDIPPREGIDLTV